MIYQNPQILYALFALAIPIIIHLFNFRKHEKIYFSSIRFLEEIKTKNRKKKNLKNILILLSRILALLFLILAFAKPYIPHNNENATNNIFIYLDNSFSMNAISEDGRLLDIAKNISNDIINTFPKTTKFYLLTNDFKVRNNKSFNKEKIIEEISKIESSGNSKTISQILDKKESLSNESEIIYIISDLQENSIKIDKLSSENKNKIIYVPVIGKNISNLSIDSVWIDGPILLKNTNQRINFTLNNQNVSKDVPISLEINNKLKINQLLEIDKDKNQEFNIEVRLDSNINICKLSIEDYPITFDNQIYFNLIKNDKTKIVSINGENKHNYIERLFLNDTTNYIFKNQNLSNINYQNLLDQEIIILNEINKFSSGLIETIKKCIENGSTLIVIPSSNIDIKNYNYLFNMFSIENFGDKIKETFSIKKLAEKHPLFNNVFEGEIRNSSLPTISKYYKTKKLTSNNKKAILTLENNEDFLSHYIYKKSNIYVFNTCLHDSTTNFHKNALFVPVFLNMVNTSLTSKEIYNVISLDDYFVSVDHKNQIYNLKKENFDIIPTTRFVNGQNRYYTNNQLQEAGQYKLFNKNITVDHIAYNYSSKESNLTYLYDDDKLLKSSGSTIYKKNISGYISESFKDKHFWKTCIILSLLFFGIEILLLKLIKT